LPPFKIQGFSQLEIFFGYLLMGRLRAYPNRPVAR
jgi:hypothetical protein